MKGTMWKCISISCDRHKIKMQQIWMAPIKKKNPSADEKSSKGHGIWVHVLQKASNISLLKMQSRAEDFIRVLIRNYIQAFLLPGMLPCKMLLHTMKGFVPKLQICGFPKEMAWDAPMWKRFNLHCFQSEKKKYCQFTKKLFIFPSEGAHTFNTV